MISYGRQSIDQSDIDAVISVLKSDFLTQGKTIDQFEQSLCQYTTAQYCSVVTNATSALHLACLALDINSDSLVWTSPISFVASSNCALYCGAKIDFIDINLDTHNIDISKLEIKLAATKQQNKKLPDLLIVVHMGGLSVDMAQISELSKLYGFKVVEDASHAIGGAYQSRAIGSCEYSEAAIFSFHPVKIITTGEGGAITTNSASVDKKIKLMRSHGITRDISTMEVDDPWYYEQKLLGFNFRMTDIQAALGLAQMSRLEEFVKRRRYLANYYNEMLKGLPLELPDTQLAKDSSWHLYVVKLVEKKVSRRQLFDFLRSSDIGVNVHYIPIYKQPYYQSMGFTQDYCPNAEDYYRRCISLPLHPGLTEENMYFIVNKIREALN